MTSSTMQSGVQGLRRLMALSGRQAESDEQLLHAFTTRRDDVAFGVLVRRHGPMVFHVCRRVLGHEQDAEDAFQATFLVLARKPSALRDKSSLASFLHGIAYRTAMKAKQSAARRGKREGQAPSRSPLDPTEELYWREVRAYLDEEISRLPEKYRIVFVLCCLENLSQVEAARRLRLKERTLSSQLTAARKRLQRALRRRGVELTAVLAATALATPQVSALPASLTAKTLKAVLAIASDKDWVSIVSPIIAESVQGTTALLMASKAKIATAVLVLTLLGGAGLWLGERRIVSPPLVAAQTGELAPPRSPEKTVTTEIHGQVLDPDGKPIAGAKLRLLDKSLPLGTTEADGGFRFAIPNERKSDTLIAQAAGFGIDFIDLPKGAPKKSLKFRLVKDRAIRGRIVNTEGKPVVGARVAARSLGVYANHSIDSFLFAWKKRDPMSGVPGGVKHIWAGLEKLFAATTDADGRFVLHGLGDERLVTLSLHGGGVAEDELWIVNRDRFDPAPYNAATLDKIRNGMRDSALRWLLYGPDLSVVVEAEKILRGVVKASDTGKGRPGILVHLTHDSNGLMRVPLQTHTDAQGRYEIHGARKVRRYMIEVAGDPDAGYMDAHSWVDDTPGYQPIWVDITVKKGVIVTGKMIDKATGKPVHGHTMVAVLNNNPFVKEYPPLTNFHYRPTSADGTFREVTIPGPVLLMGGPSDFNLSFQCKTPKADPKYLQYFNTQMPNFPLFYNPGGSMTPVQGNYCKVLDIKPDAKVVQQDIVLERASVLPVRIQDADGKPLRDTWVAGNHSRDLYSAAQCKGAECSVYELEPGKPRLLVFYHAGRKLVGTLTLKGDEIPPVAAKLGPIGSIRGQLLDADGTPLVGIEVEVHYHQRTTSHVHNVIHRGKQIVTDANGLFAVDGLIPQQRFDLSFRQDRRKFERTPKLVNAAIEVKPAENRDLGAIGLKRLVE